jgi:hypothetical protein
LKEIYPAVTFELFTGACRDTVLMHINLRTGALSFKDDSEHVFESTVRLC